MFFFQWGLRVCSTVYSKSVRVRVCRGVGGAACRIRQPPGSIRQIRQIEGPAPDTLRIFAREAVAR